MATLLQIKFNFGRAEIHAKRIDDAAREMRQLARTDMDNINQNIHIAWKGDNARQYLAKSEQLREQISRTAGELENIAANIRSVAKTIYNAEMESLRIAQQRDGGHGGGGGGMGGRF